MIKYLDKIGLALILLPLLCYVIAVSCLAIRWHITPFIFLGAFFLSGFLLYKTTINFKILLLYSAIVVFSICLGTTIWDVSYDGSWYHADLIHKLAYDNYNPYYKWKLEETDLTAYNSSLWITHYSKGYEIIASTIVSLTGNLESGKSENLFFFIGTSLILFSLLCELFPNLFHKITLLVLIMGNPVVIGQLFTHYVDWTCYVLLLIMLISIYRVIVDRDYKYQWIVFLISILVINIKINVAFWVFFFSILFVLFLRFVKKIQLRRKTMYLIFMGWGLGLLASFNPYYTNYSQKGHPLWPLAGENVIDIMTIQVPDVIMDKNRIEATAISLVCNPSNTVDTAKFFHNIFGVDWGAVIDSSGFDTRLGGFGIFFFEAMTILLITFVVYDFKYKFHYLLVSIIVFLSLLLLPSGWWARYVCYFYLLAPMLLFALYRESKGKFVRLISIVVTILLLLNITFSLFSCGYRVISGKRDYLHVLNYLRENKYEKLTCRSWNALFVQKMKDYGIPITIVHYESMIDSVRLKIGGPSIYIKRVDLGDKVDDDYFVCE